MAFISPSPVALSGERSWRRLPGQHPRLVFAVGAARGAALIGF